MSAFPPTPPGLPDFIIAGAPKCGTTALHSYLATHPGLTLSARKEPYYWCPDIAIRTPMTDPAEYAALWRDAPPGALKGEATPAYLRSEVAVPAILAAQPATRFILILRSPAAMAASFHSQMVFGFQEDVGDFEKAWRLQERRRQGARVPSNCFHPPNLQYADVCALGDQLERFASRVPPGQRLVLLYDDLIADPRAAYLRMLEFLGVPDDGRTAFEAVNRNRNRKALGLVRFHRSLPQRLGSLYPPLREIASRFGLRGSTLERLSLRQAPRPPLARAFEHELLEFFRPQVEKIEAITGRDLSRWKRTRNE